MMWAPPTLTLDPLSSNSRRRPEDAGLQIGTSAGSVNSLGNSPAKRGSFSQIETTVKRIDLQVARDVSCFHNYCMCM